MKQSQILPAILLTLGLALAGYFVGNGFVEARALERTAVVKGLAEREVPADTAIWPLALGLADHDLEALLARVDSQTRSVLDYLAAAGFDEQEITVKAPAITDRHAQSYGGNAPRFRYYAQQVVTVYTDAVDEVLAARTGLRELSKSGIVFVEDNYEYRTQFLFNGLNEIKPAMIEEATQNARLVAEKFAADSQSRLGKIKSARQGQFSIVDRDSNNPHIKKVRIVSTLTYYLAD